MMSNEYEKLHGLYEKSNDVVIARAEGSINEALAMRYQIFSFPVVVLFLPKNTNIASVFEENRTMENMKKWIERNFPKAKIENKDEEKALPAKPQEIPNPPAHKLSSEDMDFIRKELNALNDKIGHIEEDINLFRNMTRDNIENNNKRKNQEKAFLFKIPDTFILIVFFGALLVFIAVVFIFKKLFFKKSPLPQNLHAKV
jgi:hypothetical protein